jgi:simple sugar transport system substrate-binding protein
MVEMAPYRNMHPDTKFEAIALQKALTKGDVHSFEGPIYNQAGELMVPKGEVADDGMLAGMNWYVKGIDGQLPQ